MATSAPETKPGVLVVRRHHLLVRCSHWLNVPILLGLTLSGMSIYWASPVYRHKDPQSGNFDPLADIGVWICAHVPGLYHTAGHLIGFTTTSASDQACWPWLCASIGSVLICSC